MAVATFDTLKFANTLKAAGVPDKQAEAQAVAFAEVIQLNLKEWVTKEDLAAAAKDLKQDLAAAAKDLKQEVAEVRKDLKQEVAEVRAEGKNAEQRVAAKTDVLAAEQKTTRAELKGEMVLLRWMVGVGLTVSIALLGIVLRLLMTRP